MTDNKIAEQMENIRVMIKKTKDDKLYYAFLNFCDDCVISFTNELKQAKEENTRARKANEASHIEIIKSKGELHDMRIESKIQYEKTKSELNSIKQLKDKTTVEVVNKAQSEIMKLIIPFFSEMPNVNKAILNKPRFAGLLLLLQGRKFIFNITKVNLDDILNGKVSTDTSSKEDRKE